MNDPAAEQRCIYRNIHNRPKGRGIIPLSASGLNKSLHLGLIEHRNQEIDCSEMT